MARTTFVGKILLLGMLAYTSLAQAQQAPSSAPPKLERIEEGSGTPITVTPKQRSDVNRGGTSINEKREGGRVTEVEVTTGGSSYTMKGAGAVAQTGDATGNTLRPPQWKVMEFDLFKKKQKDGEEADAGTANAPPPPPLPPPTAIKQ